MPDEDSPAADVAPGSRWDTNRSSRTVLFLARTLTSAVRLLDVLEVFRGDFRVQPVFAVDERSRSGAGVLEVFRNAGVHRIVPWAALRGEVHYDLAISASEQIDLGTVTSTTIVVPHGVGFNKHVPDAGGPGVRIAGLPPEDALRTGRVRLVLSHPDQRRQLSATAPEVAAQTVVTGDPMFDRLRSGRPLRDRYRDALEADGRTVVLLSSTWGADSVFGSKRELFRRLTAELPADEYRVCAALHPNIWSRHGPAVVRTWLADCLDAGLNLLPPHHGWQAALIASDLVLGDHGSVTLLAAALGTPLMLAAFGPETEVVAGTPVADLGRLATRLDPRTPLRDQLDKAIATHDPRRFASLADRTFAHVGEATERLRNLIYEELDLTAPTTEPILHSFPDPPAGRPATAFDVYAASPRPGLVTLRRHPRPVHEPSAPARLERHLAVDDRCPDLRLIHTASVLVHHETSPRHRALERTATMLHHFPGARVTAAAIENGCVAAIRGEGQFEVSADTADTSMVASALHHCLINGQLADGRLTVRAGSMTIDCETRKL